MSKGYLENEAFGEVMVFFRDMMRGDVKPNRYSLPEVLKACCKMLALREGEELHCLSVKNGFKSSVYCGTILIELYSGCGCLAWGYRVFAEMIVRNVVVWTTMINCYAANGDLYSARSLFDLAPERDIVLWNRMITAYMDSGDMLEARKLFDTMPVHDLMSFNVLLNGYANNGDVLECCRLFNSMKDRNIFTWNALIRGYLRNGCFTDVFDTFKRMLAEAHIQPNDATIVFVLTACSRLASLDFGKWMHIYAENNGYKANVYVCNALMEMYAKCGCVESAISVFRNMPQKDMISWNTIINVLAVHGHGAEALHLFSEMKATGRKPDGITFVGVLNACSHMGLVKDGLHHFHSMKTEYSVEPRIEHYGCVVDLLARRGLLDQAMKFLQDMPIKPDVVIWTTLLAASRVHKKLELAELCLQKLIDLDPENPANYVTLSNVYGEAQKWKDLARLKVALNGMGLKKQPGCSSIETEDGVLEFYAFDERHPKRSEIYEAIRGLTIAMTLQACGRDDETLEFMLETEINSST